MPRKRLGVFEVDAHQPLTTARSKHAGVPNNEKYEVTVLLYILWFNLAASTPLLTTDPRKRTPETADVSQESSQQLRLDVLDLGQRVRALGYLEVQHAHGVVAGAGRVVSCTVVGCTVVVIGPEGALRRRRDSEGACSVV